MESSRDDAQALLTEEALTTVADDFADDRPPGTVVGSCSPGGALRRGVDSEGLIGVDNGALRLRPLARPGWGREAVAYGPYPRAAGLGFAARVLNGHNASQTYYLPETRPERVRRWLGDVRRGRPRRPRHHENLAVGWSPSPAARAPERSGNGFVMHAATADNGELWVGVDGHPMRAVRGVQNVEILYVTILRDRGAAYYVASVPGACGLGAHPAMRPVGLDVRSDDDPVFASIQQRILGEVGYRVDTRVAGVRVAPVERLATWYGTATAADTLAGSGPVAGSDGVVGGSWVATGGVLTRGAGGAAASTEESSCLLDAVEPVGLLHVVVHAPDARGDAGLVFRASPDGRSAYSFTVGGSGARLEVATDSRWTTVAVGERWHTRSGRDARVQVLDDGITFGLYLDGRLVFDRWFVDEHLRDATGVGLRTARGFGGVLRAFESHPREVPIPPELDLGAPWCRTGDELVLCDRFSDSPGDLAGAPAGDTGRCWERTEGEGRIERTADGGRVVADRSSPNPGRTLYTVPWDDPGFADVSVELTHPGDGPGHGHAGRGGLVLWQDADNYLVVNLFLDDSFDGASISSFYRLAGREIMYDAVWTLVPGVGYGTRNRLRVAFDGMRFLAWLDGRPSLHRALSDVYADARPLAIRRVGLVVNWEWGDDTGTVFHELSAARQRRDLA